MFILNYVQNDGDHVNSIAINGSENKLPLIDNGNEYYACEGNMLYFVDKNGIYIRCCNEKSEITYNKIIPYIPPDNNEIKDDEGYKSFKYAMKILGINYRDIVPQSDPSIYISSLL